MLHPVNVLFAYVGPETMLPLASALAAVVGVLLFGWRWVAGLFTSAFNALVPGRRKRDSAPHGSPPGPRPAVPTDDELTGTPGTR